MVKIKPLKNIIIILFLLNFFISSAQESTASANVSSFSIESKQLNSMKKIWVYLPQNYSISSKKYPVIYMHDGQNLFDNKTSYTGEWNVDETLDSIKAQVIIIGVEHGGEKRIDELTPFKHPKYSGGNATAYLDFIVNTLKPEIDKKYRTKTNAKNTGIFGSSLGGLVSFYAALIYPNIFGKVGCFSPSFWFCRDELKSVMDRTTDFDTKIYFLCGDNEGDDDVVRDMENVEKWVNTKRCECKKMNKKVIVKGGQHNEKLWRENFKKAYLWLF